MVKKELIALSTWALMIALVLGLFLVSPKPTATGFASKDLCAQQAKMLCMTTNYDSSPQLTIDTNLCNGKTGSATLYSNRGNHKFVFNTGDLTFNTRDHVCILCADGRAKVFDKNNKEVCSTL